MPTLITPFPIDKKDGAGWVSTRLNGWMRFSSISTRAETLVSKSLWAIFGMLAFPFLHPIYTRYSPVWSRLNRKGEETWLNHSQTFALCLLNSNSVLVCHDLQCHCEHRFKTWARWSERLLLRRAKRVMVLSSRDAKLVSRYYQVPPERIGNLVPVLMPGIHPFERDLSGARGKAAFLGTLARKENREGLRWFVEQVLPGCPGLQVSIIGQVVPEHELHHPQLTYLGFVEDLQSVLAEHPLMLAPLFSRAGIKIKVVEALLAETPVLGTTAAYGGLRPPADGWCTNDPADWIRTLNQGGHYQFHGV